MASIVVPHPTTTKISSRILPDMVAIKPGYVKIRLLYLTSEPKNIRSLMLADYGAFPPYPEDVCIFLPRMRVFTVLETFLPAFKHLQRVGILHEEDKLIDFRLLNEDKLTMGYVF